MQGFRVPGLQGFSFRAARFYIPKRFRKPHFSEFKGSRIAVFEFFRGLGFFKRCGFESFRVGGLEGCRVLGFQGCRVLHTDPFLTWQPGKRQRKTEKENQKSEDQFF